MGDFALQKWTPERQRTLKEADWVVGWLRKNGPATTREVAEAVRLQGFEVRAHVLSKALRKSPFVMHCGHTEIDGIQLSLWNFDHEDQNA